MNQTIFEVFTDYVCPWCYLGDARVKKIKKNFDVNVKLVHFPLHPETPKEGRQWSSQCKASLRKRCEAMLSLYPVSKQAHLWA